MSQDMPTAFCILCGANHILGIPCDVNRLEWVRQRRVEIAQGVDWEDATPMPEPPEVTGVSPPALHWGD